MSRAAGRTRANRDRRMNRRARRRRRVRHLRRPRVKPSSYRGRRRRRAGIVVPVVARTTTTGAARATATMMTTMMTTLMMTRRSAMSARARILAWIMVIVTIAAVVIVGATARVMFARVEARANMELTHEAEKFQDFALRPDPSTGKPYREVAELLNAHLQHNLPERDETLFSLVDGEPHRRSVAEPAARLDRNPEFVARAARAKEPAAGSWETSAGFVAYAVLPVEVSGDPHQGHLVIVEFLAQDFEEARRLLWMMAKIGRA